MTPEPTPADRAFAWMEGWGCAAGTKPIPDKYATGNPDFSAGWKAGKEARKQARAEVERMTGYTFAVLRLADAVDA